MNIHTYICIYIHIYIYIYMCVYEFSTRGATGLVGLIRSFRAYDKRMVFYM